MEWPRRFAEKVAGFARELKLRERFVKILPQDLASTLPTTPDPVEIAQWLGKAFQKQGADYYLKVISIVLCAYYLADLTALLAERFIPDPPPVRMAVSSSGPKYQDKKSINDYAVIFSRNLFNSRGIIPGEESGETNGAPSRSTLPITLIGTLIFEDSNRSIATLEDKSTSGGGVFPVRIDDEIPSKIKIISIESRRVVFKNLNNGHKEYVDLPAEQILAGNRITLGGPKGTTTSKAPGIENVGNNQFNISRAEVDKTLSDLNNVLTQARAVPHFEGGVPAGYKLFQIVPGSIYDKLGLKEGDQITGLNGQAMTDPGKAFEMLNELKTSSHLELGIKRDGKQSNFVYDIR